MVETAPGNGRLLVISPIRNEAAHIEQVVAAVAGQERPPDLWLIVDDGSADGTAELAERLVADLPFARLLRTPENHTADRGDRLAAGGPSRAWSYGFGQVEPEDFEFVANLDGDIVLPPHYLATMLKRFGRQPNLGIAGGAVTELRDGTWCATPASQDHPTAPARIYRRTCLEAIGGMPEHLGADVVTAVYARMHGSGTRTFVDLPVRHLRPIGAAQGTRHGLERQGRREYILHHRLPWAAGRALKIALTVRPYGLSGLWHLTGYLRAAFGDAERVPDPEFAAFARRERRRSVRAALTSRLRRRPVSHP